MSAAAGATAWASTSLAEAMPAGAAPANAVPDETVRPGPREALRILLLGNRRWVQGTARHPRQSPAWRHALAHHQRPFATVVACIDSRVPPELVFDCGLGEILVVRTGAQTLDDQVVLGSIEFGPVVFESARLMLVLGHRGCGAVKAAIESFQTGKPAPGHIEAVVRALRPAYEVAVRQHGNLLENTIRAQILLTVRQIQRTPLLKPLVRRGQLLVVGGRYDMETGHVAIIA